MSIHIDNVCLGLIDCCLEPDWKQLIKPNAKICLVHKC